MSMDAMPANEMPPICWLKPQSATKIALPYVPPGQGVTAFVNTDNYDTVVINRDDGQGWLSPIKFVGPIHQSRCPHCGGQL